MGSDEPRTIIELEVGSTFELETPWPLELTPWPLELEF